MLKNLKGKSDSWKRRLPLTKNSRQPSTELPDHPVISLLTDFGTRDPYLGILKGVILSINRSATLVDISHDIEPSAVGTAAFFLQQSIPYFPPSSIHVAIVDPSVGSRRRALLIETDFGYFIGPDNGIFSLVLKGFKVINCFEIANKKLRLPHPSSTFHGRDIFAPAAAYLSLGLSPQVFGPKVSLSSPKKVEQIGIKFDQQGGYGHILHVDHFGNLITTIPGEFYEKLTIIEFHKTSLSKKVKTFSDLNISEPGILIGSSGYIEIVANQNSAASICHLNTGDPVRFYFANNG